VAVKSRDVVYDVVV